MGARRVLLIAVLAAAVLIGFVAVQNLASSAVYYLTPTEARQRNVAAGTAARLGGQVETGSLKYEPQTRELRSFCPMATRVRVGPARRPRCCAKARARWSRAPSLPTGRSVRPR